ncbi:MAG: hypothetical protein OEY24_01905 [Candidatus Bathyarchaeota archaeon]|nr:hypothetical protein [Candidatus Bathyarchaeota archaeon]MDH5494444.1 hypothetical protein [Candidatus Bathyarchaeota archaeon]
MKKLLNKKGQFSIIAALLVAIVLVTAIITTYSIIRNTPIRGRPQILGATNEMNLAINRVLEFVVGYYGSILQVTGNRTYAQSLVADYLRSSLENIAYTHPDWSPSFHINYSHVGTSWFNRTSSSEGSINVTYSLIGIGIYGIRFATSVGLDVTVNPSNTSSVLVNVTRDNDEPYPKLGQNNFFFYSYNYIESVWELNNNGLVINSIMSADSFSVYNITTPSGIDPSSYMLQVVDSRGIMVSASTFSHYTYTFSWNQILYSSLSQDTMVVEALQNGTLRWLGQNLQLTTSGKPIPPIPVKAFHTNQTINGVSREVPFQTEDWGSNYKVPLGLTSNASVFSNRHIFVFLWNHEVEKVTLWWDGRDIANQTPYARINRYFTDDVSNPDHGILSNGKIDLTIHREWDEWSVTSTLGVSSAKAEFLRINDEKPAYGASPSYVIHDGIVRDIVQQEAEWSGGVNGCPNLYAQIVVTLPANATYYTYVARIIFVNSTQSRNINDLSAIQLTIGNGQPLTENGTATSTASGLFYNFTDFPTGWAHHWSEFITGTTGAGIMFTDDVNRLLYFFDDIAGQKTGALNVISSGRVIEFNPVEMASASFQYALDISWHGAVVNFDGTDPIYSSSGSEEGLWVMVESPPTVAVSTAG